MAIKSLNYSSNPSINRTKHNLKLNHNKIITINVSNNRLGNLKNENTYIFESAGNTLS